MQALTYEGCNPSECQCFLLSLAPALAIHCSTGKLTHGTEWLASVKKVPESRKFNPKITIKTQHSMLTCVAQLAQVDSRRSAACAPVVWPFCGLERL